MLAPSRSAGLDAIRVPQQSRGEPQSGSTPTRCAEGGDRHLDHGRLRPGKERWGNRVSGTGRSCADPAKMPRKETGPVAERKQLIEDWLGPS